MNTARYLLGMRMGEVQMCKVMDWRPVAVGG
jgi:hypothetical protein